MTGYRAVLAAGVSGVAILCAGQAFAAEAVAAGAGDAAAGTVEEIVITGTGIRASLENAQKYKRAAPAVVEVIAPQDLGKFTDSSISDAFQRVPGVQIQRDDLGTSGERASIRGLGPAFITVTVNGRTPVSYGSEGIAALRSYNLDSLPSEVVAGVVIYKTPTADIVESGPAGAIDLQTFKPLDYAHKGAGPIFGSATASIRDDNQTGDAGPRVSGVLAGKFLNNTLGLYTSGVWSNSDSRLDSRQSAPVYANLNVRNASGGVDVVKDVLYPSAAGNVIFTNVERLAFSNGLQWRPTANLEINLDHSYDRYTRESTRFVHLVNIAGANGSLRNSIFEPGSIAIEDGTVTFIDFSKITPPSDGGNPNNIKTGFDTRSFAYNNNSKTEQFGGNIAWTGDQLSVKGDISHSKLNNRQLLQSLAGSVYWFPSNNGVIFDARDHKDPLVTIPNSANIFSAANYVTPSTTTRIFQNKSENTAFRLDGEYKFNSSFSLQAGARYQDQTVDVRAGNRGRNMTAAEITQATNVLYTGEVLSNSASGLLGFDAFPARDYRALMAAAPQTFLPDTPNQVPFTGPFSTANDPNAALPMDVNNSFYVKEKTTAFYVQAKGEGDIGGLEYKGNAGVRAVKTDDKAIGFQGVRVIDQATNRQISSVTTAATAQNDYWTYLPSANVSLFLRPDVTLRLGVARTMARPEFERLAPIAAITKADPTQPLYNPSLADTARIGNANLKPQTSWNYDATVEYYPGDGAAYYASLYYKDVKDFVFTGTFRNQTLPGQGNALFDVTTGGNLANGTAKGFEVGGNQAFTFLSGIWQNFGIQANYTYVDSEFDTTNPLLQYGFPGSSKHNANGTVYYEDGRLQARVSYVYRSNYLALLGNGQDRNQLPTFTRATGTVDASIGYKVLENLEVMLTGTNLTKADRYDYIYNTTTFREHDVRSRTFSAALRATF
jgi:TonB-dependent receptor